MTAKMHKFVSDVYSDFTRKSEGFLMQTIFLGLTLELVTHFLLQYLYVFLCIVLVNSF